MLSVRDQGLSRDGEARKAQLALDTPPFGGNRAQPLVDALRAQLSAAGRPGLAVHLAGELPLQVDRSNQTRRSRSSAQLFSLIFIVALLLVVFRAALAPLVTLLPAALALLLAGPLIAEAARAGVNVSQLTQILLVVLVLGAGTDYGLFLIFRVREEIAGGADPKAAVTAAMARVGETITFSAATVIAALLSLLLANFGLYRGLGPGLAIGIATVLVAGLTLLPALLAIVGRAAFWPSHPRPGHAYRGAWGSLAARVVERPRLTLICGVVLFAGLAFGLLGYSPAGFGGESAPAGSDSARGDALLQAHFPAAERNPNNILLRYAAPVWQHPSELAAADSSLRSARVFSALAGPLDPNGVRLSAVQLAALHARLVATGVIHPRASAGGAAAKAPGTTRGGNSTDARGARSPHARGGRRVGAQARASAALGDLYRSLSQFVSPDGRTVQFYATLAAGIPSSTAAANAVPAARRAVAQAAARSGAIDSGLGGEAAGGRDVSSTSTSDLARVVPLVLVIIAVLLAVLLRSLVAPLYLIVSVGLSYLAALGLAVLVFVVIGGNDGLNFVLPFFMFIFLMALGEDYNILVMTRIREEAHASALGPAVSRAIAATGGTVTSAGLVLAGTFAVLTITGDSQTREIGLGLAAGVLLDTFLVRTLLIPSIVVLLGRWNWWPSTLAADESPHGPARSPAVEHG